MGLIALSFFMKLFLKYTYFFVFFYLFIFIILIWYLMSNFAYRYKQIVETWSMIHPSRASTFSKDSFYIWYCIAWWYRRPNVQTYLLKMYCRPRADNDNALTCYRLNGIFFTVILDTCYIFITLLMCKKCFLAAQIILNNLLSKVHVIVLFTSQL